MTSDNDKKAAKSYTIQQGYNPMDAEESLCVIEESFLAGCEHKQKEIDLLTKHVAALEERIIMREEEFLNKLIKNKVVKYY